MIEDKTDKEIDDSNIIKDKVNNGKEE